MVVTGLDCADCARRLEQFLRGVPGVREAHVNFAAARAVLRVASPEALAAAQARARALGFALSRSTGDRRPPSPRALLTILAGTLLAAGWLVHRLNPVAAGWLYVASALVGGLPVFRGALAAARERVLTVDVLVSLAVVTALAGGESLAAAEVVVLMGAGRALEERTLDHTRRSVRGLLALAPKTAWRRRGDSEEEVLRDELQPGDLVIVRPGDRVPVDGTVIEGLAEVSEAPITGEARLRTKGPGDAVFAGSLAQGGALVFCARQVGPDTTLARMAGMVEEAQLRRAPVARQVDRFAGAFIPIVLGAAALVLLVTRDSQRAVTMLIGACPCALVLSTPVAVYAAIGAASRRGLLIKGGIHLERLGSVKTVVLDKTGTLTQGGLEVAEIAATTEPDKLLALAAAVERLSEHPVGRAIVRAAVDRGLAFTQAGRFDSIAGAGVRGSVDGQEVLVGSERWMLESRVRVPEEVRLAIRRAGARGLAAVIVAVDGAARGVVALADRLRPDSGRAVKGLLDLGLEVILLSGDAPDAVSRVAGQLGVKECHGGLLPEDKARAVQRLSSARATAMVGDGLNDAPALAAATVGIAIGRTGSDLTIEAADVVLLADDLTRLPELVRIGRLALANIRVNLAVSGLAIAGLMIAASLGLVGPALGALVHEGSAMLVILNAMRLLGLGAQEPFGRGAELGSHEPRSTPVAAGGR